MNKKNTTKKSIKPTYVVDITNCEDTYDTLIAFAKAKQGAGQPITNDELNALIDYNSTVVFIKEAPIEVCVCNESKKKGNIFKRFWNWLLGRN